MKLLWLGLALTALSSAINLGLAPQSMTAATVAMSLAVLLLWCVLTLQIGRGRNWARVVYLLLTIAGLPLNLPIVAADLHEQVLLGVLSGASVLLPVLGLGLLFTAPAGRWFRPPAGSS